MAVLAAAVPLLEGGAPYPSGAYAYDPERADRYYGKRFPLVALRLVRLAGLTLGFNVRLFLDWRLGNLEKFEKQRAKEALKLCTQLGPTFIKLGQALSIRTDLLPEAYALELRQLQDAVPPFDSAHAKRIIASELRLSVDDLPTVFAELSDEPLAAASIGQVYKGRLKDGREVAVKVQRPKILSEIALDLYILRLLVPVQVIVSNIAQGSKTYPDDFTLAKALVDEWGRGFVAETDYVHEARNTEEFVSAMKSRGLDAVTAPSIVRELSTRTVLVTEWVDGTRLDLDASPDVPRLCAVAINAYLTMLLDTGCLHCDPHPGNLLRTRDGRLCILDWGMTLPVPGDLQYSLIEFIAHVNAEDLDAIPQDFVNLGFTPPDKLDQVSRSGMTEGVAFVLRQLSSGGGPKKMGERVLEEMKDRYGDDLSMDQLRAKAQEEMQEKMQMQLQDAGVDVQGVTNYVEEMSRRNKELFRVPPYILYVSRAFSTLEGIGLSIDDDYSIVKQAFPYLSRRLLTDDSPRARAALRSMIYGSAGGQPLDGSAEATAALAKAGERKSVYGLGYQDDGDAKPAPRGLAKLVEMSEGFTSYTASTADADVVGGDREAQEALVELITSEEGGYVQSLLLEEAAKLADAVVRERIAQAAAWGPLEALGNALRSPKRTMDALPLPLPGPLAAPANFLDELADLVPSLAASDESDMATLETLNQVWDKLAPRLRELQPEGGDAQGAQGEASNPLDMLAAMGMDPQSIWPDLNNPESRLRKQLPVLGSLGRKFGVTLLRRVAARVEADASTERAKPLARAFGEVFAERVGEVVDSLEPAPAASPVEVEVLGDAANVPAGRNMGPRAAGDQYRP